jgi:hypothetical protein
MIFQMGHDASIIGLQEVLEHQAGEQLMLRKLLGTARMPIGRQRSARRRQGGPHHILRRLARNRHINNTQPVTLAN